MAMNIPVNLMATAVPPTQVQTAAAIESVTASMIQPAMGSAGARGATADGGAGSSAGKGQAEQRVKALMQHSSSASAAITPDRAEPILWSLRKQALQVRNKNSPQKKHQCHRSGSSHSQSLTATRRQILCRQRQSCNWQRLMRPW
jgi:hypothetical protein